MSKVSIEKLVVEVAKIRSQHPALREGQTLFNCLSQDHPELAEEIRATELDPFYDDKRIPAFFEWLLK